MLATDSDYGFTLGVSFVDFLRKKKQPIPFCPLSKKKAAYAIMYSCVS
jgi:hypothetical protein